MTATPPIDGSTNDGVPSDEQVIDPQFRSPFTDHDRELLDQRAPHLTQLLDDVASAADAGEQCRSLDAQTALAALKAIEQARREIEALATDHLAHYMQVGDSTAHGYRTVHALLEGEFRIPVREARRRTHLSTNLTPRTSTSGEPLPPLRPAIADHFTQGRISAEEARTLCDAVDDLPSTIQARHADQVEKTLVQLAPTVRLKDIPKLSQRIIQHIDPDGSLPQYETNPLAYTVTLTQKTNGDWRLSGLLDCPTGTTLQSLLTGRMKGEDIPVTIRPRPGTAFGGKAETGSPAAGAAATGTDAPASGGRCYSTRNEDSARSADTSRTGIPDQPDSTDRDGRSETRQGTASAAPTAGGAAVPASDRSNSRGEGGDAFPPDDTPGIAEVGPPGNGDAARNTDEQDDSADSIPQVPLEVDWFTWKLTLHADGTSEVNGHPGTFLENEPQFFLDENGWPVYVSRAASDALLELLDIARRSPAQVARRTVREKILCRRPTTDVRGAPPPGTAPPGASTSGEAPPGASTSVEAPPGNDAATEKSDTTRAAHDSPPLGPTGVREDGTRNTAPLDAGAAPPPGLIRHDRLAFLLRCAARQRILHGADHALVVTARPEDLTEPHRVLQTHSGGALTTEQLESWSSAARMFVHIVDGGGRTVEVRSQGRFATRSQIAVLAARDQGCTFPDCDAPAEWCEAHHIVPYSRGGETTIDNLTLVCPFHHRWFERKGWVSRFAHGFPAWEPPRSIDPRQRILFHSRFRVALLNLPPEFPGMP